MTKAVSDETRFFCASIIDCLKPKSRIKKEPIGYPRPRACALSGSTLIQ